MPKRPAALLASPDDTEAQFYDALQHGDIDKLMAVWAEDEDIVCVHPGGPRLVGAGAIRAAFEALFAAGPVRVEAKRVRRVETLSSAVHSVVELVRLQTADGPREAHVLATNVYIKTPYGWRMVCHHASPGTSRDIEDVTDLPAMLH